MQSLFVLFTLFLFIEFVVLMTVLAVGMMVFQLSVLPLLSVTFAVGLAAVFILAYILNKNVVTDVRHLFNLAESVSQGQVVEDIHVRRKDELGALADALSILSNRDKAVRQANEDPLTGLANRRYLTQKLAALFQREKPLSLVFIDLDGFKPINDTYGHDMGDEALKAIADRLRACVRDTDLLCRIGGDEFVILFNGLDDKEVLKKRAERILELVNEPIWVNDTRLKMGASLGIAVTPGDGRNEEELINAADEAMYAAKQGGKNAFRFYS